MIVRRISQLPSKLRSRPIVHFSDNLWYYPPIYHQGGNLYIYFTSSNQRLGSVFYRTGGVIMENWVMRKKQLENYGYAFLAGRGDCRCTRKRGLNPLKKNLQGRPIYSLHKKILISLACETKLGCVLSFLENAITLRIISQGERTLIFCV